MNDFFSNHEINENHTLKTDMMKISEDDINNSAFDINENLNKSENNKNDFIDKEEEEDDITKEFEVLEFKNEKNKRNNNS